MRICNLERKLEVVDTAQREFNKEIETLKGNIQELKIQCEETVQKVGIHLDKSGEIDEIKMEVQAATKAVEQIKSYASVTAVQKDGDARVYEVTVANLEQLVLDKLNEEEEKKKRIKNLIIFGVPEDGGEGGTSASNDQDVEFVKKLVKFLDVDTETEKAVRLGKKKENEILLFKI